MLTWVRHSAFHFQSISPTQSLPGWSLCCCFSPCEKSGWIQKTKHGAKTPVCAVCQTQLQQNFGKTSAWKVHTIHYSTTVSRNISFRSRTTVTVPGTWLSKTTFPIGFRCFPCFFFSLNHIYVQCVYSKGQRFETVGAMSYILVSFKLHSMHSELNYETMIGN